MTQLANLPLFSKSKFNLYEASTLFHWLVLIIYLGTVQIGTGKVDPSRKFKCSTAACDSYAMFKRLNYPAGPVTSFKLKLLNGIKSQFTFLLSFYSRYKSHKFVQKLLRKIINELPIEQIYFSTM